MHVSALSLLPGRRIISLAGQGQSSVTSNRHFLPPPPPPVAVHCPCQVFSEGVGVSTCCLVISEKYSKILPPYVPLGCKGRRELSLHPPSHSIHIGIHIPKCVPTSWKGNLGGEEGRGSDWLQLNDVLVEVGGSYVRTQPFPTESRLSP